MAIPGRLVRMGIKVEELNVVVTIFKVEDTPSLHAALRFNFYCHKISAITDVILSADEQIDIVGKYRQSGSFTASCRPLC